MSFETFIGKEAAFKVTDLFLQIGDVGSIPVSSFNISMQVNGPNVCNVIPCFGQDRLNRRTVNPNFIERISPKDDCSLYMRVKNNGKNSWGQSLIFKGRLISSNLELSNSPLGSNAGITLTLRHASEADLMGVSICQRSYYDYDAEFNIFKIDNNINGLGMSTAFKTQELEDGKFAVYLKQLATALVRWYMNNNGEVDVNAILKAVPCTIRETLLTNALMTRGKATTLIPEGFMNSVKLAFEGATASKATLMSVISSLSSYALLSLVPTLRALVISPSMEVAKWTRSTGIYLDRKWIQGVSNPSNPLRFPIERVTLNRKFIMTWSGADIQDTSPSKLFSNGEYYTYPETGEGSVLIVDPPPILSGVICCTSQTKTKGQLPTPIDKGGAKKKDVNSLGSEPLNINPRGVYDIARQTAILMWSKLAYAHHSAVISVLPHWVFNSDVYTNDTHAKYDIGSVWSAINKTIMFKMPYTSVGYGQSDNDIAYVGYVKGMSMSASVETAQLGCTLNVTNVRTAYEDQQFALPIDANPLYDNTTANPV